MTASPETIDPSLPLDAATTASVEATLDHLNENHADTVLLVARHLTPGAIDAEVVRVDRRGAVFAVRTEASAREVRLAFPAPIAEAHEVQQHLLAAMSVARAAADPATPLTSLEHELQVTASLRTVHGRVGAVRRLTPNLLEVTLAGFEGYPLAGADEFVYVMMSSAPGGMATDYGMEQYRQQDPDDLVRGAYYSVRRSRPEVGEIDLWVVEHDHPGSVGQWFGAATGEPIALWGPRTGYRPPADARHVLLVADESGFAAVAATLEHLEHLERLAPECRVTAVLETVDADHRPELPTRDGVDVVWIDRGGDAPGRTNRLLDAVSALGAAVAGGVPGRRIDSAFGAGESRQISAVRRHVRGSFELPAARVLMTGYWRRQAST